MNILFLSALNVWSGGESAAGAPSFYKTIQGYLDSGHSVYLITNQPEAETYAARNLRVWCILGRAPLNHRSRTLNTLRNGVVFPFAAALYFATLRSKPHIDLIYGYEIHGILAGYLLKKMYGKPLVSRFQGTNLYPIVLGRSSVVRRAQKFDHFLAFKVPADLAIVTNDGTYGDQVLRRLNPVLAEKSHFWLNGVDPLLHSGDTRNVRAELGLDESTNILMTLSRLQGWKRVDRAIRALPHILEKRENVVLIIVGYGPDRQLLEDLAGQLGVDDHVIFTGMVTHSAVCEYLKNADVFLSLYELSNLGNPLLEALRMGRPIITIGNGDTASVIEHGVNGVLLDSGSPEEVAAAVLDLLAHPEKRARLAQNARKYSEANLWDWDTRMQREIEVVSKLVQSD